MRFTLLTLKDHSAGRVSTSQAQLYDELQDDDPSFVSRGIAGKPPKYVDLLKLKVLLYCSRCSTSTVCFKPAHLHTSAQ